MERNDGLYVVQYRLFDWPWPFPHWMMWLIDYDKPRTWAWKNNAVDFVTASIDQEEKAKLAQKEHETKKRQGKLPHQLKRQVWP